MQNNSVSRRRIALAIAAPFVIYALSIGPVAGLSSTDQFNEALLPTVYWPFRQAARVNCIGRPTVAYIDLFLNLVEREAYQERETGTYIGWGRGVPGAPISTPGPPHDFALRKGNDPATRQPLE
jgi:hypothetical protein